MRKVDIAIMLYFTMATICRLSAINSKEGWVRQHQNFWSFVMFLATAVIIMKGLE